MVWSLCGCFMADREIEALEEKDSAPDADQVDTIAAETTQDAAEVDEVSVEATSDADKVETAPNHVTQSPARYANAVQIGTKAYADEVTTEDIINADESLIYALVFMKSLSDVYPAIPGGTGVVADPMFDDLEAQKDAMRSGMP